jgi:uncharacterized protein (DUF488 family)
VSACHHGNVTLFTVGHGARNIEAFLDLLRGAGVRRLVDIRTAPGSRKHPHFGRDALEASLAGAGVDYVWEGEALGGWRRPRQNSRHASLRSSGFRGYADHMETEDFREARQRLIDGSARLPTTVMCAESLWWRCHRRLLADALLAAGCEVRHIMDGPRLEPHRLSPQARIEDGLPVYDVPEDHSGQRRIV